MITVAALYVAARGIYSRLPGIDLWPELRDARLYAGPWPVVAHPPCSRWCRLAGLVESRYGHKRGDDGGTFAAALASVRQWGGVLEHPAHSAAWAAYDLPRPPRRGWARGLCGGWACEVEQAQYGHKARKTTWLYAYGTALPALRWGEAPLAEALVSWCRNTTDDGRPRIGKSEASATPPDFAEVLLSMARSSRQALPSFDYKQQD